MVDLIASIVLLYAVVGSAAVWYRRSKARLDERDERERHDEQTSKPDDVQTMRHLPQKGVR